MKKKLLLLTVCATLLFTGCSGLGPAVKEAADSKVTQTPEPAPTATPGPTVKKLKLGKNGTIGDWKVCVKKATVETKIKNGEYRYFEPGKGNQFVSVTISVKNKGKKEAAFLPSVGFEDKMITAILCYKDEYEYKPTQLLSYDKDLTTKQIKPLASKSGVVVFEVPKKIAKTKKKLSLKIGTTKEYLLYQLK